MVSVIMPCYNAEKHLPASLASVAEQKYRDFELIAVNDGSVDGTLDLLHEFSRRHPWVTVIDQENRGLPSARNRGLAHSRGKYVAFLDSDDTWSSEFLLDMTECLESHPDCVLAYCGWQNVGLPGGRSDPFVPPDYENEHKLESFLTGCRWPVHAALTRKSAVLNVGGFDEKLQSCEDYDLWLRIAPFQKIVRVPRVHAYYRHHNYGQMSDNAQRMALYNYHVQKRFIHNNPKVGETIGNKKAHAIVAGELNHKALHAFWHGDPATARTLFRKLAKEGYLTRKNAKYLLASMLPHPLFRRLAPAAGKMETKGK